MWDDLAILRGYYIDLLKNIISPYPNKEEYLKANESEKENFYPLSSYFNKEREINDRSIKYLLVSLIDTPDFFPGYNDSQFNDSGYALAMLSYVLDQPNHSYTDKEIAALSLKTAVRLFNPNVYDVFRKVFYNLLKYYKSNVGLDKAVSLCEKIFENSPNAELAAYIRTLYMDKMGIEGDDLLSLPDHVKNIIVKAAQYDRDNVYAGSLKYAAACFLAQGLGVYRDEEKAVQYYEELVENPSFLSYYPLRALVIRYALGWGVEADIERARELYYSNPDMRCDCEGYYEPIEILLNNLVTGPYVSYSKTVAQYIRTAYETGNGPQIIRETERFRSQIGLESKVPILYALKVLARSECWESANDWADTYSHFKLIDRGYNPEGILADTWRFGPFYNPVAENGLPVLGLIQDEHFGTPGMRDGDRIEPGIVGFKGLTANKKGELKLHFTQSAFGPALLLPEDVDTALALAFGEEEFQWPSIDIQVKNGMEEAQLKKIDPPWLIETPIGPTFYITDFLGGRLTWALDHFEIANTDLGHEAKRLVEYLKSIDLPNPPGFIGKMINVHTDHVARHFEEAVENGESVFKITMGDIKMRIVGGYTVRAKDGTTKEWQYKYNTSYAHGRVCAELSEHFDTVAEILPVYERLRQFIGMVYALKDLRDAGFEPHNELWQYIFDRQYDFESRIKNKQPEYARSLPLKEKLVIGC